MARTLLVATLAAVLVPSMAAVAQDATGLVPTAAERALIVEPSAPGAGALSLARDETGRWAVAAREEAGRAAAIERARWRVNDARATSFGSLADLQRSEAATTVAGIALAAERVEIPPVALTPLSENGGAN